MNAKALFFLLALMSLDPQGQEIAEIDLAYPQPIAPKVYDQSEDIPKGCGSPRYTDLQGEIKHPESKLEERKAQSCDNA
jgi:hypothetical protein